MSRLPTVARRSVLGLAALALAVGVSSLAGLRPATAETYELKIATVAPDRTPWADLLKEYKTNVERASKGRILVRVFLGGTMGDENETVRMTARGELSGVGASTGAVATLVEDLAAIEIPFLFDNASEADYVLDKYLLAPMEARFRTKDLVLVMWSENGFRHFGANFPIATPADLRKKSMRSQESYVHIEMWKALEASASGIPTTEVTTALKTGSVAGFDQALLYMVAGAWHSSIKHMTLSAHIYQPAVIAFNRKWFDSLPPDLQEICIREGRALVRKGRAAIRKMNPKLLDIVKAAGVKVVPLSPEGRQAFVTKTAGVRAKVKARSASTKEIVELIEKGLAEYRAKAGGKGRGK